MPQALTVPTWYNDDYYINEKVAECNTIKFGDKNDWNADSVRAALAGAYGEETYASWMGYDNFVSNGNAENCSPSPYFVVSEYLAAKAAQLNDIKYEDKTDWDQVKVLDAFKAANISAWDHYTKYGQAEGLNPSNAFDNDAFLAAKCDVLNAWENEDGTTGYDGKTDWTPEDVVAVFQGLNINPIMNQPENPNAASLIIEVPDGEQVSGGSFNPWAGLVPPTQYNDIPLVPGEHEFVGTAGNDNFVGDLISSASNSGLQRDDVIDGDGGNDMLTITMSTNWNGFSSKGGMTDVETINLINNGQRAYKFNATGIEGAETYNLTGNINLSNVEEGVAVNLAKTTSDTTIGYESGANADTADTLALGLENVGTKTNPVAITAANIENLDITTQGDKGNFVNLAGISSAQAMTATGDGNLKVIGVADSLETFDGADAKGKLDINALNAANMTSIALGSGDDTFRLTNLAYTAKVEGGNGDDELIVSPVKQSTYALDMTGVETMTVDGNDDNVAIYGNNIEGLTNLAVKNIGGDVKLVEYESGDLTVTAMGAVGAGREVTIADIDTVTLNVGDDNKQSTDVFNGNFYIPDASTLNVNVLDGTATGQAVFDGIIKGVNVADIAITTASNNSIFELAPTSALNGASNVTISGVGDVNLGDGAHMGQEEGSLTVDAGALYANFMAGFTAGSNDDALVITGSRTGSNGIDVNGSYSDLTITTGSGNDIIDLTNYTPGSGDAEIDLGAGYNFVLGKSQADAGNYVTGDNVSFLANNTIVYAAIKGMGLVLADDSDLTVRVNANDDANIAGAVTQGSNATGTLTVQAGNGATINIGETSEDGAEVEIASGATSATVNTDANNAVVNVDASNMANAAGGFTADSTWAPYATVNATASAAGCTQNIDLGTGSSVNQAVAVKVPTDAPAGSWLAVNIKNFNAGTAADGDTTTNGVAATDIEDRINLDGKTVSWISATGTGGIGQGNEVANTGTYYLAANVADWVQRAGLDVDVSTMKGIGFANDGKTMGFRAMTFDLADGTHCSSYMLGGETATLVTLMGVTLDDSATTINAILTPAAS